MRAEGYTLAGPKPRRDQGFRLGRDARTVLVVRLGRLDSRPKRPAKEMALLWHYSSTMKLSE
jgi:hypothetical protein